MKEFAIKENHLFVKAYTKGKRFAAHNVCVYVLRDLKAGKLKKENPKKQFLNRIGFTATQKLGNAVTRNRCKRIMRAAYRSVVSEKKLKTGNLIVISARSQAVQASSKEVRKDLLKAFEKLELFA
ncbi:MAG: ribonuclease P protein component [Clostridia bacterium]|nr:ribonuclease P protein component [Clostridia bacterium]